MSILRDPLGAGLVRSVALVRWLHDRGGALTEEEFRAAIHDLHAELSRAVEAWRAGQGLSVAEAETWISAELADIRRGDE